MTSTDENKIKEYLLGDFSEVDIEKFERRYLDDNELFEQLQGVEQDLIDEYATGRLDERQNEKFERYFLRSGSRQEQLRTTRALLELSREDSTGTRSESSLGADRSGLAGDHLQAGSG